MKIEAPHVTTNDSTAPEDTTPIKEESPIGTAQPCDETIEEVPITSASYIGTAKTDHILKRLQSEIAAIVKRHFKDDSEQICFLSLFDMRTSIDSWDADRIFKALKEENTDRKKNVLLFLVSHGGRIEPAYQITKICKKYSLSNFQVVVPRRAKSAATLIAIGADNIHMGPLGELGPIDPQLDGLPALGVRRSLEIIASICAKNPKSSDAFAKYLGTKLSIEQIGYCDRVSESAVQYAERLLVKKPSINETDAHKIAWQLVNEYKDHGFVIDVEEARDHMGDSWIHSDSREIQFGEEIYEMLTGINFMLEYLKKQRLLVVGSLLKGGAIWNISE